MATSLHMPRKELQLVDGSQPVPDWGTGKPLVSGRHESVDPYGSRPPNWQLHSGWPQTQYYDLTLLKRSNLRSHDAVEPPPHDYNHGENLRGAKFPKEHSYASHMCRFDVFPKFVPANEDPKQGLAAKRTDPKHIQTPTANFDTTIVHKAAGSAYRHEKLHLPLWSKQKAEHWPGDDYNQRPKGAYKSPNDAIRLYPAPKKLVKPNRATTEQSKIKGVNGSRHPISERTSNALHNVERDQWQTEHRRHFTGHGTNMPNKLDNYEDKVQRKLLTGADNDDSLQPHDDVNGPPTSVQQASRLSGQHVYIKEKEQTAIGLMQPPAASDPAGNPTASGSSQSAHQLGNPNASSVDYQLLERSKSLADFRCPDTYKEGSKRDWDWANQKREANNRWLLLEKQTPAHNLTAYRNKQKVSWTNEHPAVFYNHMGRYVTERSNLYQTSNYNPDLLQQKIEDGAAGRPKPDNAMDTSHSHQDALTYPTDMNELARLSGNQVLTERADGVHVGKKFDCWDVLVPYWLHRSDQTNHLTARFAGDDAEARDIVLEGGRLIQRQSEYGDNYNSFKFLQEQTVPDVMPKLDKGYTISKENTSLLNVPSVDRPEGILRHPTLASRPMGINYQVPFVQMSLPVESRCGEGNVGATTSGDTNRAPLPHYTSQHAQYSAQLASPGAPKTAPDSKQLAAGPAAPTKRPATENPLQPPAPGAILIDATHRKWWVPNQKVPKPQTQLGELYFGWSKTDAKRKFEADFPENAPDLRDNHYIGRKHVFGPGIHALTLF